MVAGKLTVPRVQSEQNVADQGTKALSRAVIANHAELLGYINVQHSQPGSSEQGSDHENTVADCSRRS